MTNLEGIVILSNDSDIPAAAARMMEAICTMDMGTGIIIADDVCRLTLTPSGPPSVGFPTRIHVVSGPFAVAVEAEAINYEGFCESLAHLRMAPDRGATLEFWNEGHKLAFTGDPLGHITVNVLITGAYLPARAWLGAIITIEQSYLPQIIAGIRRSFLSED